ncbi:Hypothetical protein SRAE_X000042700 [Strongyloides ratti]|uniref:Uncharacterized protein n=1 Tax=Strongyloides ratti TaxID=34506 RepID=A0A090LMN1_STRRB|nr:Hypothetical protein SRAE_X000042700 [Strongyloides ratti]CEF71100.1 Hypothetical protein SRAE_X000042700 [Strongyloides ratti]
MDISTGFFSNQTNTIIGLVIFGVLIIFLVILLSLCLIFYFKYTKSKREVKQIALPNGLVIVDDSKEIIKKQKEDEKRRMIEDKQRKQEEKKRSNGNKSISLYSNDPRTIKASNVASVCYYQYPKHTNNNGRFLKSHNSHYGHTYAIEPDYRNNYY